MKYLLTCWVSGFEFSEYRKKCLDRMLEVYPDRESVVITDEPELFKNFDHIIEVTDYKIKLVKEYGVDVVKLSLAYHFSDCARMVFLYENINTLYIDTDVYCTEPIPTIPLDKFGALNQEICVLYNNNSSAIFKELLYKYKDLKANALAVLSLDKLFKDSMFGLSEYFIHKSAVHGYNGIIERQRRIHHGTL